VPAGGRQVAIRWPAGGRQVARGWGARVGATSESVRASDYARHATQQRQLSVLSTSFRAPPVAGGAIPGV